MLRFFWTWVYTKLKNSFIHLDQVYVQKTGNISIFTET